MFWIITLIVVAAVWQIARLYLIGGEILRADRAEAVAEHARVSRFERGIHL